MIVELKGLCKILARRTGLNINTVKNLVETIGAAALDNNVQYLGFGQWQININQEDITQ